MTYLRLPPPPSSPPPPLLPPPWPPSDESVAVVFGYFSAARLFGRCNAVHRFSHANHSGRNEPSSSSSWRPSSWSFGPLTTTQKSRTRREPDAALMITQSPLGRMQHRPRLLAPHCQLSDGVPFVEMFLFPTWNLPSKFHKLASGRKSGHSIPIWTFQLIQTVDKTCQLSTIF